MNITNQLNKMKVEFQALYTKEKRRFGKLIRSGYTVCKSRPIFKWNKLKTRLAKLSEYKDAVGYYSVLAIVLVALSAAAYDYRGRKEERTVMDSSTIQQTGIAVQTQTDPTFHPEMNEPDFISPVRGKVIEEFSDDELIWSTTLQLWQTHPALDIAASAGEAVVASANGKVVETYSDAMYGNIIAVEHENGTIIKYASLNTLELVEIGQTVRQGDVISSVGTCVAERELGPHIHIECIKDGETSDFLLLLEKSDIENLRE